MFFAALIARRYRVRAINKVRIAPKQFGMYATKNAQEQIIKFGFKMFVKKIVSNITEAMEQTVELKESKNNKVKTCVLRLKFLTTN